MGAIEIELDQKVSRANFIYEGMSARAERLERQRRGSGIYLPFAKVREFMGRPVPLPFGGGMAEPSSEATIMIEARLDRLEEDMSGIKSVLGKICAKLEVMDERSIRIEAQFPYLATKEDLANVRRELQIEIANTKNDLQAKISGTKNDLQVEINSVKSELQLDIAKRPTAVGISVMIFTIVSVIAAIAALPLWGPWFVALLGK